jgi:hypothetical protein
VIERRRSVACLLGFTAPWGGGVADLHFSSFLVTAWPYIRPGTTLGTSHTRGSLSTLASFGQERCVVIPNDREPAARPEFMDEAEEPGKPQLVLTLTLPSLVGGTGSGEVRDLLCYTCAGRTRVAATYIVIGQEDPNSEPVAIHEVAWTEGGGFSGRLAGSLDVKHYCTSMTSYTLDDGRAQLVTGGQNGLISIWDGESLGLVQQLRGHDEVVFKVCTYSSPADGSLRLLSSGGDGMAKVWGPVGAGDEWGWVLLRTLEFGFDARHGAARDIRVLRVWQTAEVCMPATSLPYSCISV